MTLKHNKSRSKLFIAILVFCLFPAYASAHALKKVRTVRRVFHHRRSAAKGRRVVARNRKRVVRRRSRVARGWRRPSLHIAPQRTEQIQQALIQAGDLHEQPTGTWDPQTRDAMKLYQQSSGFSATGLPDAKSLMKMGLGPHPLPSDVDPMAQAQPGFTPRPDGSRSDLSNPSPDD